MKRGNHLLQAKQWGAPCCNPLAHAPEVTALDGEHGEELGGGLLSVFDSRLVNPTRLKIG